MEKFKNLESNGRQLVSLVRVKPRPWYSRETIDFTDFNHPLIWAIIPCWMDKDGNLTSIKTGNPVVAKMEDEIRPEGFGAAYDYEDGSKIVYTRGWRNGQYGLFFTERTCRDCEVAAHRAFGESLIAPPKEKK